MKTPEPSSTELALTGEAAPPAVAPHPARKAEKPAATPADKDTLTGLLDEPADKPWYRRRWVWAGVAVALVVVRGAPGRQRCA
jgi:hypothetical protein